MTGPRDAADWIDTLPEPLRTEVLGRMQTRRHEHGELVYRCGEPGTELLQIVSGAVRIYTLTADGRELLYDLFPAGTCFGETSVLDDLPRAHMTQAIGPTTLRVLSRADFLDLWRRHPEISLAVARVLCARARRLYTIYESVSLAALSRRMAVRLCALSGSIGEERPDGVHFNMRLTQEDIGSLTAGARQSVNRVLKQWQGEGIIDLAYGTLVIRRLPELQRLAAEPD